MTHLLDGVRNAGRDLTADSFLTGMERIEEWRPQDLGAPVTCAPDRRLGINAARVGQAQHNTYVPLTRQLVSNPFAGWLPGHPNCRG